MILDEITWRDDYSLGVEFIDNAHKEFFKIVRRLFMLTQNKKNQMWAAQEGVKFLKNYVQRHFEEEESYMRSIGYKYLDQHIAQHDVLRFKVAPKIETYLANHQYSPDSVGKFLNILTLWIGRHILEHDKAISWANASPISIE